MNRPLYFLFFIFLLEAVLFDLFIPIIIAKKYPGYSHLKQAISDLGSSTSPVKNYECINLIIVGILLTAFSIGQNFIPINKNWAFVLYLIGIIVFAIGCIIAGLFPDTIENGKRTKSGKIHGFASAIGFLLLILNPLWVIWIKELSSIRALNIILFILGLTTFVLFIVSEEKESGFLSNTGLFQRLNLIFLYSVLVINYLQLHSYI